MFINTIKEKDFLNQKSTRSKSRKSLKPVKSQRVVETPCSLRNGLQNVDALLICELEQKINEMSQSILNLENSNQEQIQSAVDKLGEDIAIDINQIESNMKQMGLTIQNAVGKIESSSSYKNKRDTSPKSETNISKLVEKHLKSHASLTEDSVKTLIRH